MIVVRCLLLLGDMDRDDDPISVSSSCMPICVYVCMYVCVCTYEEILIAWLQMCFCMSIHIHSLDDASLLWKGEVFQECMV